MSIDVRLYLGAFLIDLLVALVPYSALWLILALSLGIYILIRVLVSLVCSLFNFDPHLVSILWSFLPLLFFFLSCLTPTPLTGFISRGELPHVRINYRADSHELTFRYHSPNYSYLLEEAGTLEEDSFHFSFNLPDVSFMTKGGAPGETGAGAASSAHLPVGSSRGVSSSVASTSVSTPLANRLLTPEAIHYFGVRPSSPLSPSLISVFKDIHSAGICPPFQHGLHISGHIFSYSQLQALNIDKYHLMSTNDVSAAFTFLADPSDTFFSADPVDRAKAEAEVFPNGNPFRDLSKPALMGNYKKSF